MRAGDLRTISLFDGLTGDQLEELIAAGTELPFDKGVVPFKEGEPADFWWVLIDGSLDLIRHIGPEDVVVGSMSTPGQWSGGFRAWDESGVYLATGRGVESGRFLQVPSDLLRNLYDSWFPLAGHLIRGVYGTARNIEATARQRGALVTLGTLSAGLAHEINNPAAAATRAIDALEDVCETLLSSLGRLAEGEISAAQFIALDALRKEIEPRAVISDPLMIADQEDELSSWMSDHQVGRDWVIAPPLAAAGVDVQWCDRVAERLEGQALEHALEWVASTFSAVTLLSEAKDSTRRVTELVAAMRSYSQMDRASMQRIDITDGLESTLVMLGHKLRDGVTVVRDYGTDVPQIEAYPGELNQVWTNLVDNAVDAMDGAGELRVTTRADGSFVVVEIGDTGPGMPPQVVERAFEAFYTTKDVGKGTGLGLDIARRIVVERHGGKIDIDTGADGTTMRVSIPVRPSS